MKRLAVILLAITMISCNKEVAQLPNPFFESWDTPYGVPPFSSIKDYHYQPAFEQAMALHDEEIDAIVNNKEDATFSNTIEAMDRSGRMLSDVSNVFGMLCAAETNDALQELEGKIMPQLAAHSDRILMNEALFARVNTTLVIALTLMPIRFASLRRYTTTLFAAAHCLTASRRLV